MHTNIDRHKNFALIITPRNLSTIWSIIDQNYGNPKVVARCCDGSTLTIEALQELLDYENPSFRRFDNLTISGGPNYNTSCTCQIKDGYRTSWIISISDADDKGALKVALELENRLNEAKTYYSLLRYASPGFVLIAFSVLWVTCHMWGQVLAGKRSTTSSFPGIDFFYLMLPILIIYSVFMIYSARFWEWLFPKVWFSLGSQEAEMEKRKSFRAWVFGTVILSLALGVIGNLISNWISK